MCCWQDNRQWRARRKNRGARRCGGFEVVVVVGAAVVAIGGPRYLFIDITSGFKVIFVVHVVVVVLIVLDRR